MGFSGDVAPPPAGVEVAAATAVPVTADGQLVMPLPAGDAGVAAAGLEAVLSPTSPALEEPPLAGEVPLP
eukprot:12636773-Alexandrium_andersonii.AAC.1